MPPDPPELNEDVDLEPEHRRYVLDVHARLDHLSYYELLGVRPDADKKAIKRAYYELARTIHPDRYFGQKLGSYKEKIDVVFARMTEAFEVLGNKEKRAGYDEALGTVRPASAPAATAPVAPSAPKASVPAAVAAKRQEAMDALKRRFADGKAKAKKHADMASLARAAGDFTGAAEAYKSALLFSPDDAALRAALKEVESAAAGRLVESLKRQATLEERHGHWAEAATSWKRIVDANPQDAGARARLAKALERRGAGRA